MKKPKQIAKNRKFASEKEGADLILDALCWRTAERMSLDLGVPQEVCADRIKEFVLQGRLVIEFDEKRGRVWLTVVPTAFKTQ